MLEIALVKIVLIGVVLCIAACLLLGSIRVAIGFVLLIIGVFNLLLLLCRPRFIETKEAENQPREVLVLSDFVPFTWTAGCLSFSTRSPRPGQVLIPITWTSRS